MNCWQKGAQKNHRDIKILWLLRAKLSKGRRFTYVLVIKTDKGISSEAPFSAASVSWQQLFVPGFQLRPSMWIPTSFLGCFREAASLSPDTILSQKRQHCKKFYCESVKKMFQFCFLPLFTGFSSARPLWLHKKDRRSNQLTALDCQRTCEVEVSEGKIV